MPSYTVITAVAALVIAIVAAASAFRRDDHTHFVTKLTDTMIFIQRSDGDSRVCMAMGRPQAPDGKAPVVTDAESQAAWDVHNALNARLALNCSFWD